MSGSSSSIHSPTCQVPAPQYTRPHPSGSSSSIHSPTFQIPVLRCTCPHFRFQFFAALAHISGSSSSLHSPTSVRFQFFAALAYICLVPVLHCTRLHLSGSSSSLHSPTSVRFQFFAALAYICLVPVLRCTRLSLVRPLLYSSHLPPDPLFPDALITRRACNPVAVRTFKEQCVGSCLREIWGGGKE
jgi:hypothetical protein